MSESESNVERELGAILATLGQIQRDLAEQKASNQALSKKLDQAFRAIESLQRDTAEIKPVAQEIARWKLLGLGAVMGIGALGTAVGISLATFRETVIRLLWGH